MLFYKNEWKINKQKWDENVKDEQLNWMMEQKGSMATKGWKDPRQQRKQWPVYSTQLVQYSRMAAGRDEVKTDMNTGVIVSIQWPLYL